MVLEFLNHPPSVLAESRIFEVHPGETLTQVADRLQKEGLITDAKRFVYLSRVYVSRGSVRVGEYELRTNMYPMDVLSVITSGKSVERALTFQEGLNRYEMAELFEKNGFGSKEDFLQASENRRLAQQLLGLDIPTLEGYLFPDTYRLNKFTGAVGLVRTMVSKYKTVRSTLPAEGHGGLNPHQVVILASVIEKETGAPAERPLISSVFHNRLKVGMRLQSDPTILYGILDATKIFKANITRADLHDPTPYNTYTIKGLPIGPISNPGRESLSAALNPQQSEYFYFVSRNDGTHVFSVSYKDHQAAVNKFQLDPSAREGKSWRDLSQKLQDDKKSQSETESNL
jgi:UPF0755 protein